MVFNWGLGIEKEFPINIGPYKAELVRDSFKHITSQLASLLIKKLLSIDSYDLYMDEFDRTLREVLGIVESAVFTPNGHDNCYINFKSKNMTFYNKAVTHELLQFIFVDGDDDIETQQDRLSNPQLSHDIRTYVLSMIDAHREHTKAIEMVVSLYGDFNEALCECIELQTTHGGFIENYLCGNICNDIQGYMHANFFETKLPLKKGTEGNLFGIQREIFNKTTNKPNLHESAIFNRVTSGAFVEYTRNYVGLDVDPGGFEVRTDNFKNVTADTCTSELAKKISATHKKITSRCLSTNEIENNIDVHFENRFASYYKPILYMVSIDRFKKKAIEIELEQIYSGDNELNITLPYIDWEDLILIQKYLASNKVTTIQKNIIQTFLGMKIANFDTNIKKQVSEKLSMVFQSIPSTFEEYVLSFDKNHIDVMKSLRLLSPLFFAVLTGVNYLSFGDDATIPETSKRFMSYSGYRIFTSQLISALYKPYINYEDYNIETHSIFKNIMKEHDLEYTKNQHIMEFSVNRKQVKYNPTENPKTRKMFGFEWKVLDQYPTEYIPNIILFVVLLSQWVSNRENLKIPHVEEFISSFHPVSFEDFIETIFFQGWNTEINTKYSASICHIFAWVSLHNKIMKIPFEQSYTCADFLQDIFGHLYTNFMTTSEPRHIIECFFPDFISGQYQQHASFPSVNFANYCQMIKHGKQYHPDVYNKKRTQVASSQDNEDFMDLFFCENFESKNDGFDF
tara:strand:+ start:4591 stop:6804 length:2214 start_codon:yes stop_codon:yes gene_type:complete